MVTTECGVTAKRCGVATDRGSTRVAWFGIRLMRASAARQQHAAHERNARHHGFKPSLPTATPPPLAGGAAVGVGSGLGSTSQSKLTGVTKGGRLERKLGRAGRNSAQPKRPANNSPTNNDLSSLAAGD